MKARLHLFPVVAVLAIVASPCGAQPSRGSQRPELFDSTVYADSATAALIARAREHHRIRSSQLSGYRAKIFTRTEGRIATGRFSRGVSLFTYEAAALVRWMSPGDVRVEVQGARSSTARLPLMQRDVIEGFWTETLTGEPWFIPASLGDYIQLMGIPDDEALHPLARRAERYYRYAVTDSLQIGMPGRAVRAIAVSIQPTYLGPTLLSGTMWLDADSLDVVRLTATVVGDHIWDDDEDAPVMKTMEVDLEYGLHLNRFWLPFRQIVTPTFTYKYLPGATIPASAVTTFSDYDISVDTIVDFDPLPRRIAERRPGPRWRCEPWDFDSHPSRPRGRCGEEAFVRRDIDDDGNRWEIVVPSLDSLRNFEFGSEFEVAEQSAAEDIIRARIGDMAALSEKLPHQLVQPQTNPLLDPAIALQAFQYNRVQGPSLGGGHTLYPDLAFTTLHATARFGFGDLRPTASLVWRRDAPRGRLDLEAFRALRYAEPWTVGTPIGNSLKALFSGHDDADYYLALGGGLAYTGYQGALRDVELGVRFERQRSMAVESGSVMNDFLFGRGVFQPNPSIVEDDFVHARAIRTFHARRATLQVGADGLFGDRLTGGRVWGSAMVPYWLGAGSGFVRLRGGAVAGDSVPQLRFRAGGPETVRGYSYGVRRGEGFWSAQWEQELKDSQYWAPVVFVDVGDVVTASYEFDPLVGVGAGVALLSGWMRLEFSKGVNPSTSLRFDLLFRMPL